MACEDCNETNVPEVDNSSVECCELTPTNCVVTSEAVPCLQVGKGSTLTNLFKRLCAHLKAIGFLTLKDSPSSYEGQAGKCVKVNDAESGVEFDDCCCETVVHYDEREIIEVASVAETPSFATLPGTSYTIPVGEGGTYEVLYTGDLDLTGAFVEFDLELRVNGTLLRTSAKKKMSGGKIRIGFTFFVSEIVLLDGDVVTVDASSSPGLVGFENLNYQIKKLP